MDKQDLWGTGWRHGPRTGAAWCAVPSTGVVGTGLMEAPETVREVHQAYATSGCPGDHHQQLCPWCPSISARHALPPKGGFAALAGQLARDVADEQGGAVKVAGSLPPLFGSLSRTSIRRAGERAGDPAYPCPVPHVDLWLAETMSLIAEPPWPSRPCCRGRQAVLGLLHPGRRGAGQ